MDEKPISIRFKLDEYLRPGSHKIAISLPELVAQTNAFSIKNRAGCKPTLEGSNPKALFLNYNVRCSLKESDPDGHEVRVRFDLSQVKDKTTAKNLDVAVSCGCPAFLYWGAQWNTYQRDALEGEPRPLLTAPTERLDLRGHFVICKHISVVASRILPSVQHNINNLLRDREVEKNKQKSKPSLSEKQQQMRERMDKKKQKQKDKDPNKTLPVVQQQLQEGLSKRSPVPDKVITRDTPATEKEKLRNPTLEQPVDEEDNIGPLVSEPVLPVENPRLKQQPDVSKLEDGGLKAAPAGKPQKMPVMNKNDREQMKKLVDETSKPKVGR